MVFVFRPKKVLELDDTDKVEAVRLQDSICCNLCTLRCPDFAIKEYYLEDAECILISYGSAARSAFYLVEKGRLIGERLGLLELQTLWPFPYQIVKEKCRNAKSIVVVESNAGQKLRAVRRAVDASERVFLVNRIDGLFITPADIRNILRYVQCKGA